MLEFTGLASANPNLTKTQGTPPMTDLQMVVELEKRGWKVNKDKK